MKLCLVSLECFSFVVHRGKDYLRKNWCIVNVKEELEEVIQLFKDVCPFFPCVEEF